MCASHLAAGVGVGVGVGVTICVGVITTLLFAAMFQRSLIILTKKWGGLAFFVTVFFYLRVPFCDVFLKLAVWEV